MPLVLFPLSERSLACSACATEACPAALASKTATPVGLSGTALFFMQRLELQIQPSAGPKISS